MKTNIVYTSGCCGTCGRPLLNTDPTDLVWVPIGRRGGGAMRRVCGDGWVEGCQR